MGEQLRQAQRQLDTTSRKGDETAGHVAEIADILGRMSPRLDDVEQGVAALGGAVEAAAAAAGAGADEAEDEALSLTPALRWSQLDRDDKHAAWDTLSGFVSEVLNSDYQLTRLELPDCWPVHPRAVRELAWLRTLYISSSTVGTRPELVAEWHVRWLPAAITNLAVAIDRRECAPGKHRLTEEERRQYDDAAQQAERAGQTPPALTSEGGVDRPRYLPARFPPLRGHDPSYGAASNRPQLLDAETPPPPSRPEHWWEFFLDARLADIGDDAPDT
ncbi:hypothetical protein FRP1_29350 (plasmid) [Pseudonocardia sp. EC080625-04]|uniref:hypothetical protein n=1 Tax=Pseudonocardia sp. EC080619-01 TaxID=1096856 RepID=UPI0006CB1123|nr:hypothetical protein [Pseudonocardia sp. EC080619-01]ALE76880.1 hypothetical protein FRP1_29350 [Pseudonocardia sp. EC080625-04]ALL85835.1 hypothetical protein AD017_32285 [Pseudonocardia sp. EC080619-01]